MLTTVEQTLHRFFEKNGFDKKYIESKITFYWDKIAGEKLKDKTQVSYYNRGTLFIEVCHSSWANELQFLKNELIQKINNCLQKPLVKDIKFKVNGYQKQSLIQDKKNNLEYKFDLTDEEINSIEADSALCTDEEIRYWIKKILAKEKMYNKYKEKIGWQKCRFCSSLQNSTDNICPVCAQDMDQQLILKIQNLLNETPWLTMEDCIKLIPNIKKEHYEKAKQKNIINLRFEIDKHMKQFEQDRSENILYNLKNLVLNYTMLITGLRPGQITSNIMRQVIGNYYCQILNL